MLFSEVHHSPSAGMREHLYSVCALSVPIAAGQKKKNRKTERRTLATNRTPTNAQQALAPSEHSTNLGHLYCTYNETE